MPLTPAPALAPQLQRLKLRCPIAQAPMAGAQGYRLAAAVCAAGGLGALPAGMLTPEALERELLALAGALAHHQAQTQAKNQAGGIAFNLNFFCHQPPEPDEAVEARWRQRLTVYAQECGVDWATVPAGATRQPFGEASLQVLERLPAAARPAVLSFHFGLPAPALLARVKALGAQVWASATTVEEACWLEQHGADAVIAQGLEAGGHRGCFLSLDLRLQRPLAQLLPAVRAAVSLPVIAAGGLATPADVAAALAAGAALAQVGTAYLLCPEAETSAPHRAALQAAAQALAPPETTQTELTNLLTGRPARGLRNRLMREQGAMCADAPAFPLAGAALAPLRAWAEARGQADFSALWAGTRCTELGQTAGRDAGAVTRWLAGQA